MKKSSLYPIITNSGLKQKEKQMAMFLRILRVLVAQGLGIAIATWGNIEVPYFSITFGAVLNGVFKLLRDKFPNTIEWLPL